MSVFKPYEQKVLRLLANDYLSQPALEEIIQSASFVSCDYTGAGYFLTVCHSSIPEERRICSTPQVLGRTDDLLCGFVVFCEGNELTLEAHTFDDAVIREGFRDDDFVVEVVEE